MEARCKSSWNYSKIIACAGAEFIKTEFRRVPEGREDEAEANPYLEVRATPKPKAAPKPKATPKRKAAKGPTVKAMKAIAKKKGIPGYSKMKADELKKVLGI